MLKPLALAILFLFGLGTSAQNVTSLESKLVTEKISDKSKIANVHGRLLNYDSKEYPDLILRFTLSTPTFKRQVAHSVRPEPDGTFKLLLSKAYPFQEVWMTAGDFYFGKLLVNSELIIELDLEKLESNPVRFEGEGMNLSGVDSEMSKFYSSYELFRSDKKQELQDEKLALILNQQISKKDKIKSLKNIYKKLAGIEQSYAKKHGKEYQHFLSNDRIASMYADILSIHWGKKMDNLLYQECLAFQPQLTSNATVQYYDFLGFYLSVPNRLEIKLLTEKTLQDQLDESLSSSDLNVFLREFNKKTDHLRYDEELYLKGAEIFLDRYETELLESRIELQIRKIKSLSQGKAEFVMLLSQPESLQDRVIYLQEAQKYFDEWAMEIAYDDLENDQTRLRLMTENLKRTDVNEPNLGTISDNPSAYLATAESIDDLLLNIKASYPGHAIIVDVWVPWLNRCREDLIPNEDLQQALDSLPVKFVFLCNSNDVSQEYWQEETSQFPIEGDHIYLNPSLSAAIMEEFAIRSFPHYIFLDQDGGIDPYFIERLSGFRASRLEKRVTAASGL